MIPKALIFQSIRTTTGHRGTVGVTRDWKPKPIAAEDSGTRCLVFATWPWLYFTAANQAHDVYVRAYNLHVAADRISTLPDLDCLLSSEFDDTTRRQYGPFIEAAGKEYRMRSGTIIGPVPMMVLTAQATIPAVGILGIWLERIIAFGAVPEEAQGITMADVIEANFVRQPTGPFLAVVKFQTNQEPKQKFGLWLVKKQRNAYSDMGIAFSHEGLHLSLLSPKDSRVPVIKGDGKPAGRYMDQINFKCGKPPMRWLIPSAMCLEPDFVEDLWLGLKKLRIHLRTAVLDASQLPHLPVEVRRAAVRFHRWFQGHCPEARVIYDRVPTIGAESRSCRDVFASTGDFTPQMLQGIMTHSSAECPQCRAEVLLVTDISTGEPINRVETCGNCQTTWEVGLLLAERARVHGAFGWVPEDGYACS